VRALDSRLNRRQGCAKFLPRLLPAFKLSTSIFSRSCISVSLPASGMFVIVSAASENVKLPGIHRVKEDYGREITQTSCIFINFIPFAVSGLYLRFFTARSNFRSRRIGHYARNKSAIIDGDCLGGSNESDICRSRAIAVELLTRPR